MIGTTEIEDSNVISHEIVNATKDSSKPYSATPHLALIVSKSDMDYELLLSEAEIRSILKEMEACH